jgi:DNA-binding NarL/FixJ family response regulator
MSKPRILLVDDHKLFRTGLARLLESEGIAAVAGEASNGEEMLAMLDDEVDMVLLDIDMPVMGGREAAGRALALRPDLRIITLSMHGDEHYYFAMVEAGVKGFLLKSSEMDEVAAAIATVAEGGSYFSQELLRGLVGMMKTGPESAEEALSEREREVVPLICCGMSNQQIADKLFISKRTVDKHRANIMTKTGSRNTASLVVYAIKKGLVEV